MEDQDQEDGTMDKEADKAEDKVVGKEAVKEVDISLAQQQLLTHFHILFLSLAFTW